MCVGPVRMDNTLGEQLVQDGLVSPQDMREVLREVGTMTPSETSVALILMNRGYTSREELRAWMTQKVTKVLRDLLTWKNGRIDFAEDVGIPTERLLVSLSLSSFLDTLTTSTSGQNEDIESEAYADMETRVMQASPPSPQAVVKQEAGHHETGESLQASSLPPHAQIAQSLPSVHASAVIPPKPDISQVPTLLESAQFFAGPTESPLPLPVPALLSSRAVSDVPRMSHDHSSDVPNTTIPASALFDVDRLLSTLDGVTKTGQELPVQMTPASAAYAPIVAYTPPKSVDTSFMQPNMVMVPAELASSGEQYIPITPEHWQLLKRVDGQTTLEEVCRMTRLSSRQVCQAAGELIAESLIQVVPSQEVRLQQVASVPGTQLSMPMELSPASRELVEMGLHNGLTSLGSHASVAATWGEVLPTSDITHLPPSSETQSQWGNGGNGATFVTGQGWVVPVQPLQPLQSCGPFVSGAYPALQKKY